MAEARALLSIKSYFGDAVMAAPLIEALVGAYPDLSVLTAPFVEPVLRPHARPLRVLPVSKDRSPWAVFRHAAQLRKERFDVAVLVNRAFRAAVLLRLAGIPRRVGHSTEGRSWLLTDAVPFDEAKFEAYCSLDLARALGIDAPNRRPRLDLLREEREKGDALRNGATIAVQPGARFIEKQLPSHVLRAVITELQAEGHRFVFVGGPDERDDAERLGSQLQHPVVDLVGRTSIRETLGVLAGASVALGSDTGVMHLAAGVACPTVTVFGPTPMAKWGHDYAPHRVLQAPDGRMANVTAGPILNAVHEVLARQ